MITQIAENIRDFTSDSYQFIKGEHLSMVVVTSQILASCHINLSSYKQVVFSECHFYACDFSNIEFNNCVFENCTFEFSHFRNSNFSNCNFSNCTWKGASSLGCSYEACDLGQELSDLCRNGKNIMTAGNKDYSTDIYINLDWAC